MRLPSPSTFALVALGAVALLAPPRPAAADWLVMKDGSGKVETKGPWEVRGATLVFTRPDGKLASLRTADVDLEASKAATETPAQPAASPAPAAKPEEKKAVLTITDKDVGHVDAAEIAAAEAAAAAPSAEPTPTPAPAAAAQALDRVQVTHWNQDLEHSQDGAVVIGEIANSSSDVAGNITATVSLFDEQGKLLATSEALLGADVLQPGQKTSLRATFPGVFNFSNAKFELKSRPFKSAPSGG